jgi:hypothetical protein
VSQRSALSGLTVQGLSALVLLCLLVGVGGGEAGPGTDEVDGAAGDAFVHADGAFGGGAFRAFEVAHAFDGGFAFRGGEEVEGFVDGGGKVSHAGGAFSSK